MERKEAKSRRSKEGKVIDMERVYIRVCKMITGKKLEIENKVASCTVS